MIGKWILSRRLLRERRHNYNRHANYGQHGRRRCWTFTNHMKYTFKSTYHHTMENLVDNSELRLEGGWMKLWRLWILQKSKGVLIESRKGVSTHETHASNSRCTLLWCCVHCESSYENEWYDFFGCAKLEEVWGAIGLWHIIQDNLDTADGFVALFF